MINKADTPLTLVVRQCVSANPLGRRLQQLVQHPRLLQRHPSVGYRRRLVAVQGSMGRGGQPVDRSAQAERKDLHVRPLAQLQHGKLDRHFIFVADLPDHVRLVRRGSGLAQPDLGLCG